MYNYNFVEHTLVAPVPEGFEVTPSNICNLSSSLARHAILLIFSVNKFVASLLSLCCDLDFISLFTRQFS